jgi:hypothetical protein
MKPARTDPAQPNIRPVHRSDRLHHARVVADGYVQCPWRGGVDVVECFACVDGAGLTTEHVEMIACTWSPQEGPGEGTRSPAG